MTCIAADYAHFCDETKITPMPSASAEPDSVCDVFNYYQSSHRMYIEQAFGIMIARWGILWSPLRYSLLINAKEVQLSTVCAFISSALITLIKTHSI